MDFLQNNPFLEDLVDVQQQPPLMQQPGYQLHCKLPDFWPSNPILWFARAEFNFEVAGVIMEREKFMHTASALPYDALTFVADLVTQPPAVQPFQRLKGRLLLSHQLTTVQMAEKILDNAVDTELAEAVAALAVKAGKGKFGGGKKKQDGDSHHPGSGGKSGGGKSSSGGGRSYFVCDRHWRYGAKAYRCDAPQKCQWGSEN